MRNSARAVSKIRRTIEPLFLLSDHAAVISYVLRSPASVKLHLCRRVRRAHVSVLLHTLRHTFAHIMPPFMPRTCAEQLHFKITDFSPCDLSGNTRATSHLTTRVAAPSRRRVADTNPKFLHHFSSPTCSTSIDSINFIQRGQSVLYICYFIKEICDFETIGEFQNL